MINCICCGQQESVPHTLLGYEDIELCADCAQRVVDAHIASAQEQQEQQEEEEEIIYDDDERERRRQVEMAVAVEEEWSRNKSEQIRRQVAYWKDRGLEPPNSAWY